jgi:PAS domain S-box-containing protein
MSAGPEPSPPGDVTEARDKRLRFLTALNESAAALLSTLELPALLANVLEAARRVVASEDDKGSILLWDPRHQALCVRATTGYRDPRVAGAEFAPRHGYAARAARLRSPLVIEDARGDDEIRYQGDIPEVLALQSAVVAPLIYQDRLLGALSIDSERKAAFDAGDAEMLVAFAGLAAMAVHNAAAHEDLKASERRYRELYEDNLAGFYRTSLDGRILECNAALARILGYDSREDLLRHTAWDFYFSREEREQALIEVLEQRAVNEAESRMRRKDGRAVWVQENWRVREGEDGQEEIEGTAIDITGRRRAEEEARRLADMKTDFMIVTSHEMRTPLTILRGYLQLLQGAGLGAEAGEHLATCLRTTDRLITSFNDIVAMLEIEGGKVELRKRPCDVRTLVDEASAAVGPFLEARGLRLRCEADGGLQPALADPERLRLVLLDLLTNAIRFTPDGGEIVVRTTEDHEAHHVSVTDSGIGLDAEQLERVWDAFYTGGDSSHHSSGRFRFQARGSGLGLAIVKGYVEAHGGRVWAESAGIGRGSTFHVLLPKR